MKAKQEDSSIAFCAVWIYEYINYELHSNSFVFVWYLEYCERDTETAKKTEKLTSLNFLCKP